MPLSTDPGQHILWPQKATGCNWGLACDGFQLVRAAVAQVAVRVEGPLLLDIGWQGQKLLSSLQGLFHVFLRDTVTCSTMQIKSSRLSFRRNLYHGPSSDT